MPEEPGEDDVDSDLMSEVSNSTDMKSEHGLPVADKVNPSIEWEDSL